MVESIIRTRVLELLATRPDLTGPMLSGYTTLAPDTCKHFMAGQKPPSPNMTAQYERVLAQVEAGEILRPGGEIVHLTERATPRKPLRKSRDFYVTETVRSIAQVLNYCANESKMGVITAEFGGGKTEGVNHWRSHEGLKVEHCVFEFDEFSARNVCEFVSALGERFGMETRPGMMQGGRRFRALVTYLQLNPMLLIFDQCESVQARVCQVIRQIWDQTRTAGVGVVMLAAPLLIQRLKANRSGDLGALDSRIGIWAPLRGVLKDEIAHILKQEGIDTCDEAAVALLVHAARGSMRRLMAVVDLLAAKHKGRPITERTIQGVASHLWGLEIAGARSAQ